MSARDRINKEKLPEYTVDLLDIEVGDLCKFKGTRGKGYRRIMEMTSKNFFCRVVEFRKGVIEATNYTSTNSKDKLHKVYINGQWLKVNQPK